MIGFIMHCYNKMGDCQKATVYANRILAIQPDDRKAKECLAGIQRSHGQFYQPAQN